MYSEWAFVESNKEPALIVSPDGMRQQGVKLRYSLTQSKAPTSVELKVFERLKVRGGMVLGLRETVDCWVEVLCQRMTRVLGWNERIECIG